MSIELFSRVRLVTDRFSDKGASKDNIGFVIEAYPDGHYEVEFSDAQGITFAQIVASPEDFELCDAKSSQD